MNSIVCHFVSGGSFFTGATLVIIATLISTFVAGKLLKVGMRLIAIFGSLLVLMSATPISPWLYYGWMGLIIIWLAFGGKSKPSVKWVLCLLVILISLTAVMLELPHRQIPSVPKNGFHKIAVIGDSISAGVGTKGEQTWPQVLGEFYRLDVTNLSQPGATLETALEQANRLQNDQLLVLLEIGGNDLLSSLPNRAFENDLGTLLKRISLPNRTIVMFELPLPPFCNAYGRIQRRMAQKYGVLLIPKYFFMKVLSEKNCTLDGLHLSSDGHKEMADIVWSLINGSVNRQASPIPTGKLAFVNDLTGFSFGSPGEIRVITRHDEIPSKFCYFRGNNPEFLPDGNRIIYFNDNPKQGIFIHDLKNQTTTPIINDAQSCEAPTMSPDGSKIAFEVWPKDRESSQIYTANSDGSKWKQLTDGPFYNWGPRWSPDGKWIAFTRIVDGERVPNTVDIWIMKSDGTEQQAVTYNKKGMSSYQPTWGK